MSKTMKKVLTLIGIEAAILLLIYFGFAFYFSSHFFYNTTLNGADVSAKSANAIKKSWEKEISEYTLNIVERDGRGDTLNGKDIDLQLQWDDSVEGLIKKQNSFRWISSIFRKDQLESDTIVAYDEGKLDSVIDGLPCMAADKQVMPVDATVSNFDKQNGFTLVGAIDGTAIDRDVFETNIKESISGLLESYNIVESGGYIQPAITDDNSKLLKMIDAMNEYGKAEITYQVGDDITVVDGSVIEQWLVRDDDFNVSLDESAVGDYVTELSRKYNTCYESRQFDTSYGKTVTINNSHYGWKVDFETEKAALLEEIRSGAKTTRDLNYSMTAASHTVHDYGDSYVEINLTAQHLFLYKDGVCILETDFVSGNVSKKNGTPAGAFGITYTEKDATLKGEDYSTPVAFWMPFNGNIGLHDATWRSKFGGNIYKTAGSHGCVNLPYSAAKTIFENVEKGFPVFLYELPGTETVKEEPKDEESSDDSKKSDSKKKSSKKKTSKKKSSKKKKSSDD